MSRGTSCVPLSLSGADTISNCVALCPNCHRALHYSQNSEELIEELYINIKGCKDESFVLLGYLQMSNVCSCH
ncbi:HNH endonuclease signature motif containing protein [Klebsiella pneumoniae]|uniref:HNH endonuclease signature motif containing protein n=1 Tax=Klebsiella pneumoniae TaxID=573 RepID=UPI002E0D7584